MTKTLSDEKMAEFRKKVRKLRTLKRRVEWYQLGQRRCHCCGLQLNWAQGHKNSATVEHLVPASYGGTYHSENIIITCSKCNERRGNKDWIYWVTKNNFPKKEWLIKKYINAVEFYACQNGKYKISKNINREYKKYKDNNL